jgi:hypothetical protein
MFFTKLGSSVLTNTIEIRTTFQLQHNYRWMHQSRLCEGSNESLKTSTGRIELSRKELVKVLVITNYHSNYFLQDVYIEFHINFHNRECRR